MPIGGNPYFYNPQVGQIAGNLATAIFGDPEARMKRDYYGSAMEENYARAGKAVEETRGVRQKNDATQNLGTSLGALFAPGVPLEVLRNNPDAVAGVLTAGGGNADQQTQGLGNLFSQALAQGGNNDMRRSLVMQGHQPTDDFAGTDARADSIIKTKGDQKYRQETGVANIKAGADRDVAHINQQGQSDRFFGAPVETKQGGGTYLAPTDPRYGKVGDKNGVVRGNPNEQTIRGQAGSRMLAGDTDQSLPGLFNGSGGVSKSGQPLTINGKTVNDIIAVALANMSGALDSSNPKLPVMTSDFQSSLDPAKLQAAKDAAAAVMQRTRDVNQAGAAFRQALGIQDGDSFQAPGLFSNVFGDGKGSIVHGQPAAPAAPPATAPEAPVISNPTQLPPPEKRTVGMVINSPKGPVQWSGQVWVPLSPVN